jgi:hypothetical protein
MNNQKNINEFSCISQFTIIYILENDMIKGGKDMAYGAHMF